MQTVQKLDCELYSHLKDDLTYLFYRMKVVTKFPHILNWFMVLPLPQVTFATKTPQKSQMHTFWSPARPGAVASSAVRNLLHVSLAAPGSLSLLLEFWKFCAVHIKLYLIIVNSASLLKYYWLLQFDCLSLWPPFRVVLDSTHVTLLRQQE
jgi:hypothetical protein